MLYSFYTEFLLNVNPVIFTLISFALTFFLIKTLKHRLPHDQGREFAVNGELSVGKARGAGIIFIGVFVLLYLLLVPYLETSGLINNIINIVLISLACIEGFLDDAAKTPWGEYKKGIIDLIISVGCAVTFYYYNGSSIYIIFAGKVDLPAWLFILLATILVWASINVVNCTDGVDGLCGTLTVIAAIGFMLVVYISGGISVPLFIKAFVLLGAMFAYLIFNSSPSSILMGDAGSRAIGVILAMFALETGRPLAFIPVLLVFILDGGLGLIKVFLLRFLKIKIMKKTLTPLHDHVRKNKGWSDTQTVTRFSIISVLTIVLYLVVLSYA